MGRDALSLQHDIAAQDIRMGCAIREIFWP
jgi:hypothetical protein